MYYDEMKKRAQALKRKKEILMLAVETSCDETSWRRCEKRAGGAF